MLGSGSDSGWANNLGGRTCEEAWGMSSGDICLVLLHRPSSAARIPTKACGCLIWLCLLSSDPAIAVLPHQFYQCLAKQKFITILIALSSLLNEVFSQIQFSHSWQRNSVWKKMFPLSQVFSSFATFSLSSLKDGSIHSYHIVFAEALHG